MSKTLKASLILGLAGCIYGVFMTVLAVANSAGYGRTDLMACQYLFAAVVFTVAVLAKYRQVHLDWKQKLRLVLIGVFGFGTNFCIYETVAVTSTSFSVTMLFQYVWMGIVFDCLVTRKLPSPSIALAVVFVFVGTPLAAGVFDAESTINLPGILWGIGSAVSYTGFLWTSARLETKVPSTVRMFYFSITQTFLAILTAPQVFIVSVVDPGVWLYAIPLGLTTAVIPAFLIMRNSPKVPVGITTIMTGMELPSTIILATIFLQQARSVGVVVGVVLICVGIVVANKDGITELRKKKKPDLPSA